MTPGASVLTEASELKHLAAEWAEMTARLPSVLPTQCLEYVCAYRHAFTLIKPDFLLFTLREEGRLITVVPVRLEALRAFGTDLPVLSFMNLPMPIRDVLILPVVALAAVVDAIWRRLGKPWLCMLFRAVPSTSRLVQETLGPQLLLHRRPCGSSDAIDL